MQIQRSINSAKQRCLFQQRVLSLLLLCSFWTNGLCCSFVRANEIAEAAKPENPEMAPQASSGAQMSDQEIRAQYRLLTKKILLEALQLGRFSLNYRRYGTRRWLPMGLQYFATQEAGAAGTLALNVVGVNEFHKGMDDPDKISLRRLRYGARAAMVTGIIASAGSAVSLSYNSLQAARNAKNKFDSKHARIYVIERLRVIDQLLAEREAFTESHADHPMVELARCEGRILRLMRDAFVCEFATFLHDVRRLRVDENLFYVLNSSFNILNAVSAYYVVKSTKDFHYNAPAQIILTVSGALATVSPLLSTASGLLAGWQEKRLLAKSVGKIPEHPAEKMEAETKKAEEMLKQVEGTGVQLPAAFGRALLYSRSSQFFEEELRREQRVMKYLNSVAAQSDIIGPLVGATALAQGILGTYGHYNFVGRDERQKAKYDYAGSVAGTAGSALALSVTATAMIFDLWYIHRLEKNHKMPEQLIEDRLEKMEETEKLLNAM